MRKSLRRWIAAQTTSRTVSHQHFSRQGFQQPLLRQKKSQAAALVRLLVAVDIRYARRHRAAPVTPPASTMTHAVTTIAKCVKPGQINPPTIPPLTRHRSLQNILWNQPIFLHYIQPDIRPSNLQLHQRRLHLVVLHIVHLVHQRKLQR